MRSIVGLIVLLSIIGCTIVKTNKYPSYRFKDKVEVNSGFYAGCVGEIESYYCDALKCEYQVFLSKCKGERLTILINEESLDPAEVK